MLLNITDKCKMNCIHCMDDCKETNNNEMTFDILKKVCKKINEFETMNVVISGGECTEHSNFIDVFHYLNSKCKNTIFTITSNGINFENNKKLYDNIIKINPNTLFQITNDKRFYSNPLNKNSYFYKQNNVVVVDHIERIYPLGRAKFNNLNYFDNASKCFNLKLITAQLLIKSKNITLKDINKTLEQNLKFCSFGYDFDGNIRLGETTFCKIIGNVNSTDKEIINNILLEECNTCKYLNDKVDNFYKEIIKLGQQKLRED